MTHPWTLERKSPSVVMAEWRRSRKPLCSPDAGLNPENTFQCWRSDRKRLQYQHYHILLIRDISLVPHFCIAQEHTGYLSCCCYGYKRFCKSLTKGFNQGWDVSIHLPNGKWTDCLIRLIHTSKHARAGSSYCEQKKQTLRDISALYLHQNNCWMCWDVFH